MIYLSIDKYHIRLLYFKKTLLGQFETSFFEKKHGVSLLENGKVVNVDLMASAIKEALTAGNTTPINDRDVFLILPQDFFQFLRTEVASDIAPSALSSFVKDKARSALTVNLDESVADYFIQENQNQKVLTFFSIDKEMLESFRQALSLVDLKLNNILPDSLAYFKLFEKTLRKEKKENIFYVSFNKDLVCGYLYDSYGLKSGEKWLVNLDGKTKFEEILKAKVTELKNNNVILNRIILSGTESENIRQDTFTKAVGAWTNPLKRIIPNFYQDYLKLIVTENNKKLPLSFDACLGAFIFHNENKSFSLMKNGFKAGKRSGKMSFPKIPIFRKEVLIFVASFILSFIFFVIVSRLSIGSNLFSSKIRLATYVSPSPLPPTAAPTPTPSVTREKLKIKVLNGSGIRGKATEVRDILKDLGYQEILTGNADSFDFETTVIRTKPGEKEALDMIKADIKDYVTKAETEALEETDSSDATIIIGADFK
jgi:hypothetical protein